MFVLLSQLMLPLVAVVVLKFSFDNSKIIKAVFA